MLEQNDIERLKEIFVTRDDCTETIERQNKKFHNDDKRIEVLCVYDRIQTAIMGAVGLGVLSLVLNQFWGG